MISLLFERSREIFNHFRTCLDFEYLVFDLSTLEEQVYLYELYILVFIIYTSYSIRMVGCLTPHKWVDRLFNDSSTLFVRRLLSTEV